MFTTFCVAFVIMAITYSYLHFRAGQFEVRQDEEVGMLAEMFISYANYFCKCPKEYCSLVWGVTFICGWVILITGLYEFGYWMYCLYSVIMVTVLLPIYRVSWLIGRKYA